MELTKIMNNFHAVRTADALTVYFSYETPIAIETENFFFVSKNVWTNTTGKHVNWCKREGAEQISNEEFNTTLKLYN